jgi:ABC-2 type transport system ATP-binding protein
MESLSNTAESTPIASPTPSQTLMSLSRVTRFYGTVIGVNDLTFQLPIGAYGLVGPNGAGKSTLIGLLTGALSPSLGSIKVLGKNPRTEPSVLHRVGLCPATDILLPNVSGYDWIVQQICMTGVSIRRSRDLTERALEAVGMASDCRRPIGTYSLGMRQRCKIAQAIAHEPDLLILDEPFNGLDPIGRHEMSDLLRRWASEGRSVLLASHVLHEVEGITDAFLLIFGGRLLAIGTAGELRGMLAELPREVIVEGPDMPQLAERLVSQSWIDFVKLSEDRTLLRIAAREPIDLYQSLSKWVIEDGLRVTRLHGADGDLASLFRILVSRHRGQMKW